MTLDEYIDSKPYGEMARLARASGLAWNTLVYLRAGERVPTYATASAIIRATGGAVTLHDLFNPRPWSAAKRARAAKRRAKRRSNGKRSGNARAAAAA
jgi:DNA-binding transcriptional regulator YdaS (Cro superfamily)